MCASTSFSTNSENNPFADRSGAFPFAGTAFGPGRPSPARRDPGEGGSLLLAPRPGRARLRLSRRSVGDEGPSSAALRRLSLRLSFVRKKDEVKEQRNLVAIDGRKAPRSSPPIQPAAFRYKNVLFGPVGSERSCWPMPPIQPAAFRYKNVLFGPVGLLSESWQAYHSYRIVGEEKIFDEIGRTSSKRHHPDLRRLGPRGRVRRPKSCASRAGTTSSSGSDLLSFYDQMDAEAALVQARRPDHGASTRPPLLPLRARPLEPDECRRPCACSDKPAGLLHDDHVGQPDLALTQREIVLEASISRAGSPAPSRRPARGHEALVRRLVLSSATTTRRRAEGPRAELADVLPIGATVTLTKVENLDNSGPALIIHCDVSIPGAATVAGDKVILPVSPLTGAGAVPAPPRTSAGSPSISPIPSGVRRHPASLCPRS